MPFVELQPPVKAKSTTGVRVSMTERWGLVVSLSGEPRERFELDDPLRVLLDSDKVAPRLRIERQPDARFRFIRAPGPQKDKGVLILRVGQLPQFAGITFRGYDCTWEWAGEESAPSIDIDLPRELRRVDRLGDKVSLPKVSSLQRESA